MRPLLIAFLAIAPLLSGPGPARAEPLQQQSFGMVAGRLGGLGFTYRRFGSDGWGFGVGGIGLFSPSGPSGNLGVQGYRTLHRAPAGRLYMMAGASWFAGFADAFALGVGPGIEIGGPQGPAVALEVPLTYASSQGLVMIPTLSLLYGF